MANLLYIGSPLLDISAKCEMEFLNKYNLKADDCIRIMDEQREIFKQLLQNPSSLFTAGGSAQNSARVSKWVLRENGSVSFAGCVGTDEYSLKMRTILEEDGVKPLYTQHPSLPTGVCACLLSEGSRSMCTDLGAAATYDVTHLEEKEIQQTMEKSDIIFVVGYFLSHSPDVVKTVAQFCLEKTKLFAISLSAVYICNSYTDLVLQVILFADIVFGNYEEAKALVVKLRPNASPTIEQCAQFIARLPKHSKQPRIVMLSNGAEPLVVCENNNEPCKFDIPVTDNIVDTIGCGDALAGGFLVSYVSEKNIVKAVEIGIDCASKIIQQRGCTLPSNHQKYY